jgi:hypothetical protein
MMAIPSNYTLYFDYFQFVLQNKRLGDFVCRPVVSQCVTLLYALCFIVNNQTAQRDKKEGLEREGLEKNGGNKNLFIVLANRRNI